MRERGKRQGCGWSGERRVVREEERRGEEAVAGGKRRESCERKASRECCKCREEVGGSVLNGERERGRKVGST